MSFFICTVGHTTRSCKTPNFLMHEILKIFVTGSDLLKILFRLPTTVTQFWIFAICSSFSFAKNGWCVQCTCTCTYNLRIFLFLYKAGWFTLCMYNVHVSVITILIADLSMWRRINSFFKFIVNEWDVEVAYWVSTFLLKAVSIHFSQNVG